MVEFAAGEIILLKRRTGLPKMDKGVEDSADKLVLHVLKCTYANLRVY